MDVPRRRRFGDLPALALRGPTEPWGRGWGLLLGVVFLCGLWARLYALSAEGFADDEIHKWLAAQRYLHGEFLGDDIEHPMLMKFLITGTLLVGRPLGWAPETITRLPLAVAGALSVLAAAWLGRRLFGRLAGLVAAGLLAASPTFIGYNRVAKEDTLLGLFLLLALLCVAEAKVAADARSPRGQSTLGGVDGSRRRAVVCFEVFLLPGPGAGPWLRLAAHLRARRGAFPADAGGR